MEIHVFSETNRMELRQPEDFASFKLVAHTEASIRSIPVDWETDTGHVMVPLPALRALAGPRSEDPEWRDGLARMLAYASAHGWTDEVGAVRAHIEVVSD